MISALLVPLFAAWATTAQFAPLTPAGLTSSFENQIKEINLILTNGTAPLEQSAKETLESLKKQTEPVLPELKEVKESSWTEADGCKNPKCTEVLAKANELSQKLAQELAHLRGNKVETAETTTEMPKSTDAPKKE